MYALLWDSLPNYLPLSSLISSPRFLEVWGASTVYSAGERSDDSASHGSVWQEINQYKLLQYAVGHYLVEM